MTELIGMREIGRRLRIDTSSVRRFIARVGDELGIELQRGKGDKILLSQSDAEQLIAAYEARRGPVASSEEDTVKFDRFGHFYLIQLVPEALPNRIKIGFADNVKKRLAEHRTAAPTAKLVKTWPCKRSWDHAAMDSITRNGCKLVLNEVYEGDVDEFVARADAFFAMMPDPGCEKELSDMSPLFTRNDADDD